MKQIIEIGGREYISSSKIRERFEITYKCMANWVAIGLLPAPLRLGRRMFFDRLAIEERLHHAVTPTPTRNVEQ